MHEGYGLWASGLACSGSVFGALQYGYVLRLQGFLDCGLGFGGRGYKMHADPHRKSANPKSATRNHAGPRAYNPKFRNEN